MFSAGNRAKTCGYIARARAPHAHVREENAQKRGRFAAFRVDSGVKQTPCKQLARGLFRDVTKMKDAEIPRQICRAIERRKAK